VREFRFAAAAKRMRDLRPLLRTECYDVLADQVAIAFSSDASTWRYFVQRCRARDWEIPAATDPSELAKTIPAEVARRYVLAHLPELSVWDCVGLAGAFTDLAEVQAADELLGRARQLVGQGGTDQEQYAAWVNMHAAPIDAEIAALRDLRDVAGWTVPAIAAGSPDLAPWFGRRRLSEVAHAIGADGDVETGTWDDAMTQSWLQGGLAWAPEQWEAERAWRAGARADRRDGIGGWTVTSPQWEVFTDVSADFAGEAALVLESSLHLGAGALGWPSYRHARIAARIYSRRASYEEITHDRSGGEWVPRLNSVLSFLDDPLHSDFEQFHYPTLLHEGTHAVLSYAGVGNAPPWLNQGLACFVERWNPTWSAAANSAATVDFVRRAGSLETARDTGTLPTFAELTRLSGADWVPDDFGPVTAAHYAAAESLLVYLADDPAHWKLVGDWLAAVRVGSDPAATLTDAQRAEIEKGWRDLVAFECDK
jgi:hypothetical protein